MPLISNLLPMRGDVLEASVESQHLGPQRDSGYADFTEFDDEQDSDMDSSILHRARPKRSPKAPALPVLPQRSEKRTSKILENVMLELQSLDGAAPAKDSESEGKQAVVSDPHELYLSSEEDASFSDDESLLEFDCTSDGEGKASSGKPRRKSQEDTARVVSFTLVGKEQILKIFIRPNSSNVSPASQSCHSLNLLETFSNNSASPRSHRPPPLNLYPHAIRRSSIVSVTSNKTTATQNTQSPPGDLPPRKSSKFAKLTSIATSTAQNLQNSFLNSDPFPGRQSAESHNPPSPAETLNIPKTPTGMTPGAWRQSWSRTLLKARKTSMPKMNLVYSSAARNASKSAVSEPSEAPAVELEKEEEKKKDDFAGEMKRAMTMPTSIKMPIMPMPAPAPAPTIMTENDGPVRYEDIMRNVIKSPPSMPFQSLKEKSKVGAGMILGLGLGRRKSVKAARGSQLI